MNEGPQAALDALMAGVGLLIADAVVRGSITQEQDAPLRTAVQQAAKAYAIAFTVHELGTLAWRTAAIENSNEIHRAISEHAAKLKEDRT